MQKKKVLSLLLCLVFVFCGLCACNESASQPTDQPSSDRTESSSTTSKPSDQPTSDDNENTLQPTDQPSTDKTESSSTTSNTADQPTSNDKETNATKYQVGDILQFGTYELNGNEADGKEPVEWIVLEAEEDRILVLCHKIPLFREYHTDYMGRVSWEECALRTWLNETFLEETFSKEEQEKILLSDVEYSIRITDKRVDTGTVQDRLFLLSQKESETYFPTTEKRKAPVSEKIRSWHKKDTAMWWLRDVDCSVQVKGIYVSEQGEFAQVVANYAIGIRPAMWIQQ